MNTQATLGELVQFVLQNRRKNAFRVDSEYTIADNILHAAKGGTLLYTKNHDNQITGILIFKHIKVSSTLHIKKLLTIDSNAIKQFVNKLREGWPNHQVTAFRKQKFVRYNTPKLFMKLTAQPKGVN